MPVRGSVIKSIGEFVKIRHTNEYGKWFDSLPERSQEIYNDSIATKEWYSLEDGIIIPTEKICELFFNDQRSGSWESGRFSAEYGLTGVYKVFVVVSTPNYLMKRASRILSTFYTPSEIIVAHNSSKDMILHFTKFPSSSEIMEWRVGGWMEKALEICGCKNLKVDITKSMARGDKLIEYKITWD